MNGAAARLGVVCGVEREARALGRLAMDPQAPNLRRFRDDPRISVWLSGADAGSARLGAMRLADAGATTLMSFGLAGGLDPRLRPGDVLRPNAIVDAASGAVVEARGPSAGTAIQRLVQTDHIVATPAAKAALRDRCAAEAVDMESYAVAEVARACGLAFVVLRAVGDAYDRALPPAALAATRPDGGLALGGVLASLLRRPGQLPALLALGRDADLGLARLKALAPMEIAQALGDGAAP